MPVFELSEEGVRLLPRLLPGADLYERHVESLLWSNLEAFTGVPLFAVRRQAPIPGGGVPDIVALAADGSVFVIEVKRDVDRRQLAQCLEYAGWARRTNLEELAQLYEEGPDQFFEDWMTFTATTTPVLLNAAPKLVLAMGSTHSRTVDALDYLMSYGLPIQVLSFAFHRDGEERQVITVDVRSEFDQAPESPSATDPQQPSSSRSRASAPRRGIAELVADGALKPGETLRWERPKIGRSHEATVTDTGELLLDDGSTHSSPSGAGRAASGSAINGWVSWRVPRLGNVTLEELEASTRGTAPLSVDT